MKRWIAAMAVLLVVVLAAVLGGFGTISHTESHDVTLDAGAPATTRTATAAKPPAPPRVSPRAVRAPEAQLLQATLNRLMAPTGPNTGLLVYDLDAHATLATDRAAIRRPPASVEKLWTTTALLRRLGPNARLHTTVLGTGHLSGGVWRGDLYLRGGGDPTFGASHFNAIWNGGQGPTPAMLVSQLRRMGIRRVTGHVYGDESLFDRHRGGLLTGQKVDIPDYGGQLSALVYDHGTVVPHFDPATFAAQAFCAQLNSEHIAARVSQTPRAAPRSARLLASVDSPPMSAMLRLMNIPSDDLFADMFAKQLGVLFGSGGTLAAGAHVISETIGTTYDVHPLIEDGSGLSRSDGTSPLEIVDLLTELYRTPTGSELTASLPTVGVDGTVKTIAVKTAAQGHCVAKTGTLNYVTNLAGYCEGRDHHEIAFGIFIDGPANDEALYTESKMIAAIAGY